MQLIESALPIQYATLPKKKKKKNHKSFKMKKGVNKFFSISKERSQQVDI